MTYPTRKTSASILLGAIAAIVIGLILMVSVPGCAADQTGKEIQAREAYIGTLTELNTLKVSGQLSIAERNNLIPYQHAADAALDNWLSLAQQADAAKASGTPVTSTQITNDIATAITDFYAAYAELTASAAKAKTLPATQPAK